MNSFHTDFQTPRTAADAVSLSARIRTAMRDAREAQSVWSRAPWPDRQRRVRALRRLIALEAGSLAEVSSGPRGRAAVESLASEVMPLAEACRFLERRARRILAPRRLGAWGRPFWLPGVRAEIHREPLGVVLIIGPGNYPLLLPGVQAIQALMAGNAVLLKPGVGGAPVARALHGLIQQAGFDPRLLSVLPESVETARLAVACGPDKVLFTGAADTGRAVLAQLVPGLVPSTLELSGSDAMIVRADADLDMAVRALRFGLTWNGGATCMAPRRVLVHRSVAADFEGRVAGTLAGAHRRGAMSSGAALRKECRAEDPGLKSRAVCLGTMIEEALADGAYFVAGGPVMGGDLVLPAVVAGLDPNAPLLRGNVFAPVAGLLPVADDAEAVRRTNDSPYALGASVFSRDARAAWRMGRLLNAGFVTVNDLIVPSADPRLPFGGRGRSGFGVTRGAEGLLELTAPQVVTRSGGRWRPAHEPGNPENARLIQSYLEWTHGRGWRERLQAARSMIAALRRLKHQHRRQT